MTDKRPTAREQLRALRAMRRSIPADTLRRMPRDEHVATVLRYVEAARGRSTRS